MKNTLLTLSACVAFVLAGCAQEDRGAGQGTTANPSADREVTANEAATQAPEGMPQTQSSTATETGMPAMPDSVNPRSKLMAGTTPGPDGKPFLVDGAGTAVYALEGDRDGSKCTGECVQAWPPMLVADTQPSSSGTLPGGANMGSIKRPEGTLQITYNGQPLYHYAADTGQGSTAGHGVKDKWGQWALLSPQGERVAVTR